MVSIEALDADFNKNTDTHTVIQNRENQTSKYLESKPNSSIPFLDYIPFLGIIITLILTIFILYDRIRLKEIKDISKELIKLKSELEGESLKKVIKTISDIENSLIRTEITPSQITENIDENWESALNEYELKYRIKIEILEVLGRSIDKDVYYNLGVLQAFFKKKYKLALNYFEKAKRIAPNEIYIRRWCARAYRLNNFEQEAIDDLNFIINSITAPNFKGLEEYNDVYLARVYRSRGFCYFNLDQPEKAINDFNNAIKKAESEDVKLPNSFCGLSISNYRLKNFSEAVDYYKKTIQLEKMFDGYNVEELEENLKYLETKKKYYFTNKEKETIKEVFKLWKNEQKSKNNMD